MSFNLHISSLPKSFSKSDIVVTNPSARRRSTLSQQHIPLIDSQRKKTDRSSDDNSVFGNHFNEEESETEHTKESTNNEQVALEIMLNILKTQKNLIKRRRFHEAFNRFCQQILKTNRHLNLSLGLDLKVYRLFLYTTIKNVRLALSHNDRNLANINALLQAFESHYKICQKTIESVKATKLHVRQNIKAFTPGEKSPKKGGLMRLREEKFEESLKINGFLKKKLK